MPSSTQKWLPCPKPDVHDTIRWKEPVWAKPNKPRGKPDKIGEQRITAKLIDIHQLAELRVIAVENLSLLPGIKNAPDNIRPDDMIRRKRSSLELGECEKLLEE